MLPKCHDDSAETSLLREGMHCRSCLSLLAHFSTQQRSATQNRPLNNDHCCIRPVRVIRVPLVCCCELPIVCLHTSKEHPRGALFAYNVMLFGLALYSPCCLAGTILLVLQSYCMLSLTFAKIKLGVHYFHVGSSSIFFYEHPP